MKNIEIAKLIPGGQALGTTSDGKKIFFWNALPGEIVTNYQITKNKSHYTEAIATDITNPSPHRIIPQDECYLSTSPWQIMDYEYELSQKSALVQEVFREHHITIMQPQIITDNNPYHYRNKMEYSFYWNHDLSKIQLSFHQRGTHRKIPITNSSLEHSEIFATAKQIIDDLNANHEEARKYQSILLRCNQSGKVSGGLYENGKPHPVFPNLTDTILGHKYSYSPNGFFQINIPVYELALKEISKHIVTEQVLDLYAGVGTIGLSVARDKRLTLVEVDKFAFNELCNNITKTPHNIVDGSQPSQKHISTNNSTNIHAVLSKSEEALNYIQPNTTVILDPPRAGCDTKLINKLLEVAPPRIIYLSCNPATQARDVKALLEKYQIDTTKTFNFFPRTPHIENLVILSHK